MISRLLAGLVLAASLHWGASDAAACSCIEYSPSPYKAFDGAFAVFVGRVTGSRDVPWEQKNGDRTFTYTERRFTFEVRELLKGPREKQIEVGAGVVNSSCYVGFTIGEEYLVYAYGDSPDSLGSGMCTRTTGIRGAADDLHFIRARLAGVREPRAYGTVTLLDYDPHKPDGGGYVPLRGIKVEIVGERRSYEAITDDDGRFALADLPAGDYTIRAELPREYMSYSFEEHVTVVEGDYGAYREIPVGWNTRVKGQVLDGEGRPVP